MLTQLSALISILITATFALAAEPPPMENVTLPANPPAQNEAAPVVQEIKEVVPDLGPRAEKKYLASFTYSALDIPIPGKYGINLGIVESHTRTWEIEYLKGSLSLPGGFGDLAGVNDTRISLIGRSYYGDSFHLIYGLTYFDFSAKIGDELLARASNGSYPSADVLSVQGIGANIGLGTTWVIKKKFTLGVDWVAWAQPLVITKKSSDFLNSTNNQNDKDNVEKVISIVSYFPRFSFLSAHIGMIF